MSTQAEPEAGVTAPGLARCPETIRAARAGYDRCHRLAHDGTGPHHAPGRTWAGSQAAGTIRIVFGAPPCDESCAFPDEAVVFGPGPRPGRGGGGT